MDKGATVTETEATETLVSKRDLTTGSTTETRERWAMVGLAFQGQRWYFLVDPVGARVFNRSATTPIP